jgi:DNA-binding MarR family transcriptional regulator
VNYQYFANTLLAAAYFEANDGRQDLSAGELVDLYALEGRPGWIAAALDEFSSRGWIERDPTLGDERQLAVFLRGRGLRAAEQVVESGIKPLRRFVASPIPASDRVVTLDHNSPDLAKAISDAKQLAAQLQETNDVGNMSPEAVAVAVEEVAEIAMSLERPAVRMPAFGDRVASTMTWIAKEAAGALVGTAALGLLALLAAILGLAL